MRELIAGDGGTALVVAASSPDVAAIACEGLAATTRAPSGVPVYPVDALPEHTDADAVRLVPCERRTRETVIAWAARAGIGVIESGAEPLARPDGVRVVGVSSPSTGSGKTALVRRVARTLARSGVPVAVVRHPIANLLLWGRFDPVVVRTPPELASPRPLEEREELAPVVGTGVAVVTGLDAERSLRIAAREAGEGGVLVLDMGGAAPPWVGCDVHLVAVDLLRPPGEHARELVAAADAVVLTKADSAVANAVRSTERRVRAWNPEAPVVLADLAVGVRPVNVLADRRVVLVEDANSLIHGGLSAGAGAVAARRFRCGVVDPRPFAEGAVADALRANAHIGAAIPSLGRTKAEIDDLARSVYSTPGDAILWASNADPAGVIAEETRPVVRAFGELAEVAGPPLQDVLASLLPGRG